MVNLEKDNKGKKIRIIAIACAVVFVLLLSLPLIIDGIKQAVSEKREKQQMLDAMECWAKGETYNGECSNYWNYTKYPEIEEKAIDIVKSLKNDPETLAFFLRMLEQKQFKKESINGELANISLNIEEKISSIEHAKYLTYYYSSFRVITRDEVVGYIAQNGEKKLHTKAGTGGYYDGKEDSSTSITVGLPGSPLHDDISTSYFGDFKKYVTKGVKLNNRYQEVKYYKEICYFKDNEVEFDPTECDCYYSGKYIFALSLYSTDIYDTEKKQTYSFSNGTNANWFVPSF